MLFIYLLLSAVLIGLDQIVKYWVVENISLGEVQDFIPGILSLTHIRNTGGAWSILEGQMWFFYIITVVAVVAAVYFLVKNLKGSKWMTIGISLVLAGAVGNFIDRIRLGYVVDMFRTEFMSFPIFNVADCALVIGAILIFIEFILEERREKLHGSDQSSH